jgi:hypothetical protein
MNPDAIANIYASDIISGFDLHKPEKLNVLFNRYGDQGASYFQLLRSMGFEQEVSLDTFGHFEENRIHEVCYVAAIVAQPAIGADITFTLHANSLDASNRYYVRKWDIIMFPNEVTGSVIDIDVTVPAAPVVTCRLNDDTERFPALTEGEKLIIISDAFSEGSDQPTGAVSGTWEYTNDAQIIKETIGVTGTEMVNQSWVEVTSMGQKIPAYYMKGQIDIDYRTALKIDGALLFGKRTINTLLLDDDNENRAIKTTEGLVPYIRRVGNEQTYVDGTFVVTEFDDMSKTLDREGAGNYILGLLGIDLHTQLENALVTYFANTNIQFARQTANEVLFKGDESLGASVNFNYLTKSERTFMFKRMGSFNNPNLYGATGYSNSKLGIFLPINKKKDPVSGNAVESIGVRYRGLGAYKRRMEVWQVGGAGAGLKVNGIDRSNTYQRAHIGAHFRGGNQFMILEPA